MIHLARFCCVCLKKHKNLEKLSTIQNDYLRYNEKLSILIPQMVIYRLALCHLGLTEMFFFRISKKSRMSFMYVKNVRSVSIICIIFEKRV